MIEKDNTIVVFDIRNFSAHRYQLGQVSGGGTLLTNLVISILNDAIEILNLKDEEFVHTHPKPHFLNHTGDGFVLIVRGKRSPLVALLWISEFRVRANSKIKDYQRNMKLKFPEIEKKLPKLDFGIGAHFGTVVDIKFHNFTGQNVGVLGSSINVASRVEQTTKEHPYRVIVTKFLLDRVIEIIPKKHLAKFNGFWTDLDKHCLRGFDKPRRLYAFKPGFHKAWMCKD